MDMKDRCRDRDEVLMMKMRRLGHILYHKYSINFSQKKILRLLSAHEEMTQKELTEQMNIKSGSLCEVLAKVESAGLVRRTRSEEDKRGYIVSLTQEGRDEAVRYEQNCIEMAHFLFSVLTEEEKDSLESLAQKLIEHWNACEEAPAEKGDV